MTQETIEFDEMSFEREAGAPAEAGDPPMLPSLAPDAPILTDELSLRVMTRDDIPAVVAYRVQPEVHAYLSHGADAQRLTARLERRLARMRQASDDEVDVQLVIERRGEPGIVGDCGFQLTPAWTRDAQPTEHVVAAVHYALDPRFAGRGYGTQACGALVDQAFSDERVHRVQADVFAGNTASRKVLGRLGFRLEGLFLDDGLIDGRFVDACLYSMLRREWVLRAPLTPLAASA